MLAIKGAQPLILCVFSPTEQLLAVYKPGFTHSHAPVPGCPYYNAVHTEKLNGGNVFTFSVPAEHPDVQYVVEGNLVAFKDIDLDWQLFEIKRVTDVHGDGLTRTALCEHAFYELIDDLIEDRRPRDCSAHFALTQALSGTRWQPGTVDDLGLGSTNYYYESSLSAVVKAVSTWQGEMRARMVVTGGVIAERRIDLLARRGADTGKQFAYAKDIKEIERVADLTSLATALYGRGKGIELEEGSFGRRLTFADIEWSIAAGDPVDKPAGQEWVGDPESLAVWGRPGGRHRFDVIEDPDETDPAVLLQKTWEALQKRKIPLVSYRLNVVDLERLSGYEHEMVRLGDTVRVIDRAFSPALLVEARVIEINRDLVRPESTRIILGNFMPTIADDAVTQNNLKKMINDRRGLWDRAAQFNADGSLNTSWLEGIIDTLQNEVQAGNGSVTITDGNGILIVDNPETPTKALRLLGGLLAIADSKDPVSGEWNWRTFGTGSGFTADELRSGNIYTSVIKIIGEATQFYWDSAGLYACDPANMSRYILLNALGLRGYVGDVKRFHLGPYTEDKFGLELRNPTGTRVVLGEDGMLQTWQDSAQENMDQYVPLTLDIYIPPETLSIYRGLLRLKFQRFRAYSTGASSGGGTTPTSSYKSAETRTTTNADENINITGYKFLSGSSGDYTQGDKAAADSHNHGIANNTVLRKADGGNVTYYTFSGGNHTHALYNHGHYYTAYGHNHSVTIPGHDHTVSIPSHTHNISYGIYEDTTPAGVGVIINGVSRTSVLGGPFSGEQEALDIGQYLEIGFNTIELTSTRRGRLSVTIFIQALVSFPG